MSRNKVLVVLDMRLICANFLKVDFGTDNQLRVKKGCFYFYKNNSSQTFDWVLNMHTTSFFLKHSLKGAL